MLIRSRVIPHHCYVVCCLKSGHSRLAFKPHLLIVAIEATDEVAYGCTACLSYLPSLLLEGRLLLSGCNGCCIDVYPAHVVGVIFCNDGAFVFCLVDCQFNEVVIGYLCRPFLSFEYLVDLPLSAFGCL